MLKSEQCGCPLLQIPATRREQVPKDVQNPEIDMVDPMRVGRMPKWPDVRTVVVQQVEHVMALVFVRSDNLGVNRT